MKKNVSYIINYWFCGLAFSIIVALLAFTISSCQEKPEPIDYSYSSPRFTIAMDIDKDQQVNASLGMRNTGDDLFPSDETFNAVMNLWDQSGVLRSQITITSVQAIESDESIHLSTAHWNLTPGVYFINWGASEYGSVMGVFTVVTLDEKTTLGASQFFSMKPADYEGEIARAGSIQSFSQDENGTLILMGETPVPDMGHVFPLIFDANGLVDGMPTGQFAQIAEGRWRMEIPAGSITLDSDMTYSVLLFSDDLGITPSEPFVINFSPPV